MRAVRLTVFVLATLCLSAQLVRHTYVRWLERHESVLDKYDTVKSEIMTSASLESLEKRFAEELAKEKAERERKRAARTQEKEANEPYEQLASDKLRDAIQDWERKRNEVRELRYFWAAGAGFLVLAALLRRRAGSWLALTLQIAGISEMVWWTSPSFGFGGSQQEFARLLDNKIAFTVLSLVILLLLWFKGGLNPDRGRTEAP